MLRFLRKHPAVVFLVVFGAISVTLYFLSPERIVGYIGVQNAYIFIGVLAFLGGMSIFSSIPYHIIMVSLAVGGANPWILGLVTSFAVMLGDSTSYFVGTQIKQVLSPFAARVVARIERLYEKHPKLMPFAFFVYGSIVPLSNDVITIPMGILGYPFWRMMIPLALGNLVFNISLALLATYAYGWLAVLHLV